MKRHSPPETVIEISRILQELTVEGYPLEAEVISTLNPYWTQHINRFGIYDLDLNRRSKLLDYNSSVIPKPE